MAFGYSRAIGEVGKPLTKGDPRVLTKAEANATCDDLEEKAKKHVRQRDLSKCRCCRRYTIDVHHLVFKSSGGRRNHNRWDKRRLALLCRECHSLLHAHTISVKWTNAEKPDGLRFFVKAEYRQRVFQLIRKRLPVERKAA